MFYRIRPLQQADRRSLRISGRHQISADGRHLIDGVAFGRPFLKKTDRPPIRIPSIKRPRLVYDGTTGTECGTTELVLRENDEDELQDEFGGETSEAVENRDTEKAASYAEKAASYTKNAASYAENAASYTKNAASYAENAVSYAGNTASYAEHLRNSERLLLLENGRKPSHRLTVSRKRRRTGLGIGLEAPQAVQIAPSSSQRHRDARKYQSGSPSRRSSRSSTKSVRFDGHDIETPATVLAPENSEEEDDENFDPDNMDSESSASNKENIEPNFEELQVSLFNS